MGTTNLRIALVGTPSNNIVLTSPTASSSAKVTMNTMANWATKTNYIPREGEIIVYSDRDVIDGLNYPGVKIGDGMAYVVDLPFVGDEITDRITTALDEIREAFDAFHFDTTPTSGSGKAVTSGGIYDALNNIENIVVTDPQSDGNIIIAFT